jgi:hypothetical protein
VSGFTKLVPEIIQSSIWNEAAEVRCVWIAMIATKDADGYVRGDVRTIARMANVSVEAASDALKMFQDPDPSSHTPDNEGRRIMPAPGGWIVLNHDLYRCHDDIYRERTRERVRKHRAKLESGDDVTLQETLQKRYPSASASGSASSKEGDCQGGTKFPEFWKAWPAHPRKANKKACEKLWEAQGLDKLADAIIAAVEKFKVCEDWTKDERQFIPAPLVWLRQERWEAAGYIGNRSGVEDTPEIIEYAKQVRDRIEREHGREIGRLYRKIYDAIGKQGMARVKELALNEGVI